MVTTHRIFESQSTMELDSAQDLDFAGFVKIRYHPQSGWFEEGPSKGPQPC